MNQRSVALTCIIIIILGPTYQRPIPNLDGTDGHSEHIIFGTNVDLGGQGYEKSNL